MDNPGVRDEELRGRGWRRALRGLALGLEGFARTAASTAITVTAAAAASGVSPRQRRAGRGPGPGRGVAGFAEVTDRRRHIHRVGRAAVGVAQTLLQPAQGSPADHG